MKRILKEKENYFLLFFMILSLVILSACGGVTPNSPVINSFTADETTIIEGESTTLSWQVTDATII
ncbi:MAG: hypothetical protein JXC36_05145, partial [Candidatus Atribacteria bacterium]|nr:hypothetical protein [Candidatus Atribacteria bacterium]